MFSPVDSNTVRAYGSADIVLDIWKQRPPIKSEMEISHDMLLKQRFMRSCSVSCVYSYPFPVSHK